MTHRERRLRDLWGYLSAIQNSGQPPPSVREVRDYLGVPSTNTALYWLKKLRDTGYLTWEPGKNRTLRVTVPLSWSGRTGGKITR